jgi:hypothetical protein
MTVVTASLAAQACTGAFHACNYAPLDNGAGEYCRLPFPLDSIWLELSRVVFGDLRLHE